MKAKGNEVILFAGGDKTEAPCDEFVSCISKREQQKLLGVDHYVKVSFDTSLPLWQVYLTRLTAEINKRRKPHDILCLCMGLTFKGVSENVGGDLQVVETGIGYSGVFAPFQVFESYVQRHAVYAQHRDSSEANGRYFDDVIPNYFDVKDFPFKKKKKNYLLYMGRMVQRKGLYEIEEMSKHIDMPIIMAGMGASQEGGVITAQDCTITGKNLKYIGEVGVEKRGKLMSEARAVLCPTQFIEPFCGVNVEAQLCGTAVISPDYGAFTETVEQGKTGFRCRNLQEYLEAIDKVDKLDPKYIRERAISKYSLEVVADMYQNYFDRLYSLWDKGWYQL